MEIKEIPLKEIYVKENTRLEMDQDKINSLMRSIKEVGLLQPIKVVKEKGKYFLEYGHRRFEAIRKLGWKKIPAIIEQGEYNRLDFLMRNLVENIEREDITPLEMGVAFEELMKEGLTHGQIATRTGLSKGKIDDVMLIFNKAPEEYKQEIAFNDKDRRIKAGKIGISMASIILKSRLNMAQKRDMFEIIKTNDLTQAQVSLILRLVASGKGTPKQVLKIVNDYHATNVILLFNKEVLEQPEYEGYGYAELTKAILTGKEKGCANLLL